MHTVDLLERAICAIQRLGYRVREECLDESAGGACEINGQKWLFLDVESSPLDRLHLVAETLAAEESRIQFTLDPQLCLLLASRRAA